MPMNATGAFDEFSLLRENADDAGLAWLAAPAVRRAAARVGSHLVSAIVWGDQPAEAVLLHGGAQNAHTWDTVALALQRPVVAIDLPGHGQSDWRDDGEYGVPAMASAVADAVRQLAPSARTFVGIGLGAPVGLLAADELRPRVDRLVLVDSASGVRGSSSSDESAAPSQAAAKVAEFTSHHRFNDLEEMIERTRSYASGRGDRAVRRGVQHNARQSDDGSWSWRWDPRQRGDRDYGFDATRAALERYRGRVLLMRGELSDIVTDELVAAFQAIHRDTELITVIGAGHAVQGDRPVELAHAVGAFMNGSGGGGRRS